jgi:glycosyltransferase involved in cell wall biosynthesis
VTRLALVLESNTDRRRVEGLSSLTDLTVVARTREIAEFDTGSDARFRLVVGPASRPLFAAWLVRYLGRERFDAVVVDNYFLAALGANVASRLFGTPTLMHIRNPMEQYYLARRGGDWPDRPYRPVELFALRAVARLNAQLGRRYATVSEYLATTVRAHGTRRPVEVLPSYGVDLSVFRPSFVPREELRRRLDLPLDATIVFSASRRAPEKDPEVVLRALALLRDRGRDVRLLSTSRDHAWLADEASRAGLADRVLARDMVDPGEALADHYRASDLVVQASRDEGFGLVPIEALSCGVPVVASAVGGLRETVRDGETGWSFPVGDERALADAIEEVIDNPAEAARRVSAGQAMVRERYTSTDTFARIVETALAAR